MKHFLIKIAFVDLLLIFSVLLFAPQDVYSSEMLTLIRKIQVDHQGAAGAVDGCAFSRS